MKEKELRLALVCYGGVSLAVYMHGVTKEIWKLVRASRVLHNERNPFVRMNATFASLDDVKDREYDTEEVYFELLQTIGANVDLRVFVDTIAGASAGGINGVLLARALAHDLSLEEHRKMWLEQADILALMDDEHIANKWSKAFMRPFFWLFNNRVFARYAPDTEMREKLMLFMRSRWFEPPFSGKLLANMLLDALGSMGKPRPGASLLPMGHKLELAVAVTDYHGYRQKIPLHDPPTVLEREHRHVIRFDYLQYPDGFIVSELDDSHVPGLAFTARATSSFPGAFPAAQIDEIDEVLEERGESWERREEFLQTKFKSLTAAGSDPMKSYFIDGSVLNNKPFAEAISSLRGRPAYREVDRRIVYIDPDPEGGHREEDMGTPGFFQTLRAALSDIPRNQPVRDDLESVHKLYERVRQYRQIVGASRPHVAARISDLIEDSNSIPNAQALESWRDRANAQAAAEAGYAYEGYIQLKVSSMLEEIARYIVFASGAAAQPTDHITMARAMERWAATLDIFPVKRVVHRNGGAHADTPPDTPWISFLRDFDLRFRIRRLRFVIRRVNELYRDSNVDGQEVFPTKQLDKFKAELYECLDLMSFRRIRKALRSPEITSLAARILADGGKNLSLIDELMKKSAPLIDLPGADKIVDKTFALLSEEFLPETPRRDLTLAYIGFPFFDVLTLPLNKWDDLDDVDTLQVDRISPEDAKAIREGGVRTTLMGRGLEHFAAFFSRKARENDYLWGRLNAADRLVDIVASAAPQDAISPAQIDRIKAGLFRSILTAEKSHLTSVPELLREIESEIDQRLGTHREKAKVPKA